MLKPTGNNTKHIRDGSNFAAATDNTYPWRLINLSRHGYELSVGFKRATDMVIHIRDPCCVADARATTDILFQPLRISFSVLVRFDP